jgi:heparan-alpha-glucosaminide N-acetyltransferase
MRPDLDVNSTRLRSLDSYRGFVMLAMASGGAGALAGFVDHGNDVSSHILGMLRHQLDHVAWRGGVFWDMIQPSFMFMVGVAMPFSFASRTARSEPWTRMLGHALVRSAVLVVLALFLASNGSRYTHYSFVNVLGQIGLGYTFVFLLLNRPPAVQLAAALTILVADWLLFALYPLPGSEFPFSEFGVRDSSIIMTGFFSHWNMNANVAAAFDRWFLNVFPQPPGRPFVFNEGGYATLNFIPSMATMTFGALAGKLLRSGRDRMVKLRTLLLAGAVGVSLGLIMDASICPIVKRIWTPSWTIYSAGYACWMLAAFYAVIDVAGLRRWSFPLAVVGMNSIAIYIMAQLMKPFVASTIRTHFGPDVFAGPYGPLVRALSTLLVFWLACFWMYRQKIFVKI